MLQRIGQILARTYPLDEQVLEQAASTARQQGSRIGASLMENQGVSEEDLYRALADQFSLPFVLSLQDHVNDSLARELPQELFRDGRCFPLALSDDGFRIVVSDPLDMETVLDAQAASGLMVHTSVATPSEMERCRQRLFGEHAGLSDSATKLTQDYESGPHVDEASLSVKEILERTKSEPIVRMASLIFDEAIKLRASDIHVEPTEHNAVIRFRIDGMLRQHMEISRWTYLPLTSRIKILADLDIAEKRLPQDGRIRYTAQSNQYDFRVSTLPTHFGEKTVIRLLKHDKSLLDLANIGMAPHELGVMSELIEKPQGLIFVTGPTGSGKSTTLFACLNRIRKKPINITTIENPIEYKLEGVNQVQVNEKAGATFATVLRSILRQDPDVILVGEIRDPETAEIAIQASQTGHLVLSTLHTNDAISAVTRLRDLGVPGFLISSSLLGILAQRLVRVLCPHCKQKAPVGDEVRARWKALFGDVPVPHSYTSMGCRRCNNTGYTGRIGIYELVPTNEHLRQMFAEDAPEARVRQYVRSAGVKPLIENGILAVEQGLTTPEELLRVVLVEDILQMRNSRSETPAESHGNPNQ